jgi:hypothetical protein
VAFFAYEGTGQNSLRTNADELALSAQAARQGGIYSQEHPHLDGVGERVERGPPKRDQELALKLAVGFGRPGIALLPLLGQEDVLHGDVDLGYLQASHVLDVLDHIVAHGLCHLGNGSAVRHVTVRSIAACVSPTSVETPRVPLALPVTLPKNSPTVGEVSSGKVVPRPPISGSAPETSLTIALAMLITTAWFMVVFPRSVWSRLRSVFWVSVTGSSFSCFSRILP